MKALLALDTADRTAGVAVRVDGQVRAEIVENSQRRHGVRIVPLVDECLARAGVGRDDLGAVVVTVGPGSFTGLRVGIATALGFSTSLEIPALGVSTLDALGTGTGVPEGLVVAVLDAKKGQVYAAAYDGSSGRRELDAAAWNPGTLGDAVAKLGRPALWVGSGLEPYEEQWRDRGVSHWTFAPEADWPIPPSRVAALGARILAAHVPPGGLTPVYCRKSEAEEKKAAGMLAAR